MEITLKDKASGGSTSITLKVAEDSVEVDDSDELIGVPRITETRAPALPPRRASGAVAFTDQDPEIDMVWSQDSWHKGALRPYWRPSDPERYAITEGLDARFEGILALFPPQAGEYDQTNNTWVGLKRPMSIGITQGGFEGPTGSANFTDGTGTTIVHVADAALGVGAQGMRIITDGSRTSGDVLVHEATGDHAQMQGVTITIHAWAFRQAGSESGIKLFCDDGVTTTYSAAVATGVTTHISFTKAISGSATKLDIGFAHDTNESGAHTFFVDDLYYTVQANAFTKSATLSGKVYAINGGSTIWQWDNTGNDRRWKPVHDVNGASATDIITYDGNVFVAFGTGNSYVYGADTSWTASNRAAPDDKAVFWAIARNATGTTALWKSETNFAIANSTSGINGGATWSTPVVVGEGTAPSIITALYSSFDSIQVGKEDGFWAYNRFDPNSSAGDDLFLPIEGLGTGRLEGTTNFDFGVMWNGWLWLHTVGQGLMRWRPGEVQRVESIFAAPRIGSYDMQIFALAEDTRQLYAIVGDNTNRYLATVHEDPTLRLHIMAKIPTRDTTTPASTTWIHIDHKNEAIYVYGLDYEGQISDAVSAPVVWRYHWDQKSAAQFKVGFDTNDAVTTHTGSLTTSIYHAGMPSREKAFLALTIWGQDISSTATINVKFSLNGSPSFTLLGVFSGTGEIQTLYFHDLSVGNPETKAVGNTIQLLFTFALPPSSTGTNTGAKMFAFGLHSTLNTERFRLWQVDVEGAEEVVTDEGLMAPESYSDVLDALNTLELQTYPIVMLLDINEDGADDTITVHLRDVRRSRTEEGAERITLLLQEAKTSS